MTRYRQVVADRGDKTRPRVDLSDVAGHFQSGRPRLDGCENETRQARVLIHDTTRPGIADHVGQVQWFNRREAF